MPRQILQKELATGIPGIRVTEYELPSHAVIVQVAEAISDASPSVLTSFSARAVLRNGDKGFGNPRVHGDIRGDSHLSPEMREIAIESLAKFLTAIRPMDNLVPSSAETTLNDIKQA